MILKTKELIYMQNPVRRAIVAFAALLALSTPLAACTGGSPTPTSNQTVTATKTVPAPSPSSSPTTGTVISTAEMNFQKVSIATGLKIAQDAASPKSLTEAYAGTSVGNKRLELARGLDKQAGFPEILLSYDQKSRQVIVWSVTSPNPKARQSKQRFDGVMMNFQSTAHGPNNLERKIAMSKQLTANDYIGFFRAGAISARSVQVLYGVAKESNITLKGMVYQYSTATSTDATPITASTYTTMERVSRNLELTEIELRHGL